jgi:hypothetical protein
MEPTQKFVIKENGEIHVEWVTVEFSDVVLELLPENQKKIIVDNTPVGMKPRIFCG